MNYDIRQSNFQLSETINCQRVLDGIAIVGSTWNFLSPNKQIELRPPFMFARSEVKRELKGFRFYGDKRYVYSSKLFESSDLDVYITFLSGSSFLSFTSLDKLLRVSLEKTLDKMKSTITYILFRQSSLAKSVQKTSGKYPFVIATPDIETFGDILSSELSNAMLNNSEYLETEHYFFAKKYGQSQNIDRILSSFEANIKKERSIEIVLHIAFDLKSENKTILFLRRKVVEAMSHAPSYEYYPNGIEGAGNYYFNSYRQVSTESNNMEISTIKFYKSVYKYLHLSKAFKEPKVSQFILRYIKNSTLFSRSVNDLKKMRTNLEEISSTVRILERLIEDTEIRSTNTGRIEFIVSSFGSTSFKKVDEFVLDFMFNKKLPNIAIIREFPTEILNERFKKYILPCINLFNYYLTSICSNINEDHNFSDEMKMRVFKLTIDDYGSLLAAESLVSFFIYGTSVSSNIVRAHNNKICQELGLTVTKFRTNHTQVAPLCQGFLHFDSGILKYTSKFKLAEDPFFKKDFSDVADVYSIYNFCQKTHLSNEDYKHLSHIFYQYILKSSNFPSSLSNLSASSIYRASYYRYRESRLRHWAFGSSMVM